MTDEVLVAVDALRRGGVEQISVGDWHMVGTNVERDRMPEGIAVHPIADLALTEDEPSMTKAHGGGRLDAVVLMGHHAGTTNPRAFCSHTFVWEMEVTLDGEQLNEVQVYAQGLAAEGIPVLVATGDRWLLEELGEDELGSARLVTTKVGGPRPRARSFPRWPQPVPSWRSRLRPRLSGAPSRRRPARSYPAELRIAVEGEEIACTTVAGGRRPAARDRVDLQDKPVVAREYRQLAALLPARGEACAARRTAASRQPAGDADDALEGAALARGATGRLSTARSAARERRTCPSQRRTATRASAVRCAVCGEPLRAEDVTVEQGRGSRRPERRDPRAVNRRSRSPSAESGVEHGRSPSRRCRGPRTSRRATRQTTPGARSRGREPAP